MKICIPVETSDGLNSKVSGHFGSTPYFLIHDDNTGQNEFIDNHNQDHEHGQCHPIQKLADLNVERVICNGMGARALNNFKSMGISVFRPPRPVETVDDIIKAGAEEKLEELTPENACMHHGKGCH